MNKHDSIGNLVVTHIATVFVVVLANLMRAVICFGDKVQRFGVGKFRVGFILFLVAQITLGIGAWIVKFSWSHFLEDQPILLQVIFVSGYLAIGSLLFGLMIFAICRAIRVTDNEVRQVGMRLTKMEVAS